MFRKTKHKWLYPYPRTRNTRKTETQAYFRLAKNIKDDITDETGTTTKPHL